MADVLAQYSMHRWSETAPRGYLENTVSGRGEDAREPEGFAPNEAICPVCTVVIGSARDLRPGDPNN
jgi:hypothetical protein